MLCYRSVSESGSELIDISFAYEGILYVIHESRQPIAMQMNHDAKPNIIDTPLMLILPQAFPQYGTIHFGIVYS
jgi:hypothetical protein